MWTKEIVCQESPPLGLNEISLMLQKILGQPAVEFMQTIYIYMINHRWIELEMTKRAEKR